jgi:hypothetical protein
VSAGYRELTLNQMVFFSHLIPPEQWATMCTFPGSCVLVQTPLSEEFLK